jgi:hypothetical protein
MTITAPTKYPGPSAVGREFLPRLLLDEPAPRSLELLSTARTLVTPSAEPIVFTTLVEGPLPDVATIVADPVAEVIEPAAQIEVEPETAPGPEPETASEPEAAVPVEPAVKQYRKFSLIEPDRRWVMSAAIVFLGGILFATLASSFTGVYAMASWVGLPPAVQWLPVIILDVAIVGFSWALMVFARRGDRVWSTRIYVAVVTLFSVAANFMHTYDYWEGDLSTPQSLMGVSFSASLPIFALVATEELIRLVFKKKHDA